jgi:hypothetical protein
VIKVRAQICLRSVTWFTFYPDDQAALAQTTDIVKRQKQNLHETQCAFFPGYKFKPSKRTARERDSTQQ